MTLQFPASPTDGQEYTYNGIIYTWDDTNGVWNAGVTAAGVSYTKAEADAKFVDVSGDAMTDVLSMGNSNIQNVKDPVGDYAIIRNELLMYNPEYTKRKHILVLNKMDLQWAALRTEDIRAGVEALNGNIVGCAPIAIVPVSAKDGSGLVGLFAAIDRLMQLE